MKIINVHAISIDGAIASSPIESDAQRMEYGLTSEADQEHVRKLLEESDAVITGSSSLISAGNAWEVKNNKGRYVDWYIFSNKGLPNNLEFWSQDNIDKTIVSTAPVNQPQVKAIETVSNIVYGQSHPAEFLVDQLRAKNAQQVLLFGGSKINKLFYEKDLVTHLEITLCPAIIGGSDRVNLVESGLKFPSRAKLLHTNVENDHVFLSYEIVEK